MPTFVETLSDAVDDIFSVDWDEREGRTVPESGDITLRNGAVKLDAVFLYADLAGSSRLASVCPWQTTAKIIRAYLDVATRIVRAWNGEIRSFDGDRVMGVFIGDTSNSNAANCAREIDYMVEKVIMPKAAKNFKSIRNNDIKITHCVGIDVGVSHAVRAGIRNNNDIIWIGKAPAFAAKLSDIRNYPWSVYLSSRSYEKLSDSAKVDREGTNIWVAVERTVGGVSETVYKTKTLKVP
jgi:adenylate cyclase